MACYSGKQIADGLNVFKETFRTTGDFFKSSDASVKHLNDKGISITKGEFDAYVQENFKTLIPKSDEYFRYKKGRVREEYAKIQRELGITGKYTTGKKGKYKVGKVSAEAQETFEDIIDLAFTDKVSGNEVRGDAEVIADLIKDGITYENIGSLQEALNIIKDIRETGKSQLQSKLDGAKAETKKNSEDIIKATSRLAVDQQAVKQAAIDLYNGKGDIDTLVEMAEEKFGIKVNPDNFNNDPKIVAAKILHKIKDREKPKHYKNVLGKVSKAVQGFFAWENFDLQSYISVLDRRSSGTTDGGFLERFIHDQSRQADERVNETREQDIKQFGNIIIDAYGIKRPKFKGNKAIIEENDWITQQIQYISTQNSAVFATDVIIKDGEVFETSKAELMQLYLDSFNPEVSKSMELSGLTLSDADTLFNDYLTEQDRTFALEVMHSLYPAMYAKENGTYKEIYHTNMPKLANYGGQVSYKGDVDTDLTLTPDGNANRRATNVTLTNAIERSGSNKELNLHRNIFTNIANRIGNSAKFVGGAVAYSKIHAAWNTQAVKTAIAEGNLTNHHKAVNDRLQQLYGLERRTGGLHKVVNWLASSLTFTSLALKPKLALNQVTSASFWLIEDSTYKGFSKPDSLKGVNIAKLLYDNSVPLRERYKGENLIALQSSVDSAQYEAKELLRSKSYLEKKFNAMQNAAMWFTKVGDNVGIMSLGQYYFIGEYKKATESGMSHEEALKEGVYRFNKKFSKTQQSYANIDKSDLQNNSYGRLFTQFQTSPRQFRRITADSVRQLSRAAKGQGYKGSIGKNALNILMYHSLSGMMYQFVMQGIPALLQGEWDEDDWLKLFRAGVLGSYYNSIFLLGDVMEAVINQIDGAVYSTDVGQSSAFQNIDKATKEYQKLIKYSSKDKLTVKQQLAFENAKWNSIMYTLQAVRVPTKSLGLTKDKDGEVSIVKNIGLYEDGATKMLEGKFDAEAFLQGMGYGDYIIESTGPPAPKKKSTKTGFGNKKTNPFAKGNKKGLGNKKTNPFNN